MTVISDCISGNKYSKKKKIKAEYEKNGLTSKTNKEDLKQVHNRNIALINVFFSCFCRAIIIIILPIIYEHFSTALRTHDKINIPAAILAQAQTIQISRVASAKSRPKKSRVNLKGKVVKIKYLMNIIFLCAFTKIHVVNIY